MTVNENISRDALIKKSDVGVGVKVFRFAEITDSLVADDCIIGNDAIVIDSSLEENVSINRRNYILRSSIGRNTYTGIGSSIRSSSVGRFCSISWNVSIGGGNHVYDHVTTSPLWRLHMMESGTIDHKSNNELQNRFKELPDCVIGHDVWIATNAVILRDVKIGDGAVIGAGAVVTRDVEPYTIVAGVPAKPIRKRFDDEIIAALLEIQWWSWPTDVIRKNIDIIYKKKVDMSVIEQLMAIKKDLE